VRTVPVWAFTQQHAVLISHRRFGTTCRSHLQGLRNQEIRNGQEESSSHPLRDVSLKTRQSLFAWRSRQRRRYSDSLRDAMFGDRTFKY